MITPVALTITANNQTKVYGAPVPQLTASYNGFVNGDAPTSLTTLPTLGTAATTTSPVGSYSITGLGALDANYVISYTPGSLVVVRDSTSTAVSASPNNPASGQSVTFTASVGASAPGSGTPTGTVDFFDITTNTDLTPVGVPLSAGVATYSTAALPVGINAITAIYSGDSAFLTSFGTIPVATSKASTSTRVTTPTSPTASGQSVTFTATVSVLGPGSAAMAQPTGTVTFYANGTSIGTGTLSATSGQDQATLTTSALATGNDSITAAYTSGDGNFSASLVSPAITHVVNKDNTTTTATASTSAASLEQTVTITATVTADAPGSGKPTGAVDFYDTATSTDLTPGGVALSAGTATFSTTSLAAGSHTIKATYSGDANFLTSSGTAGAIAVGQTIFVLDPSAARALTISGNASIKLSGGVYINSSSSTALAASGNAKINATVIDVHGGVARSGNASLSPAPSTGAAVASDPFASLPSPSTSGLINYGLESLSGNSSATIKPGIYSGISASGNAKLTLSSGLYILVGGGFSISGNASATGSGVTIFNAGSKYPGTGGTYGGITLSGNGSYNLSPPTGGTYAGVVIFQPRDNSTSLSLSGNASGMTGTIYAPAAQLSESGNATLNASIDVDTLSISGNGIVNMVTLSAPSGSVAITPAQIQTTNGMSALAVDVVSPNLVGASSALRPERSLTRLTSPRASAVDQALGVVFDLDSQDTLIGDLAFEQINSSTQKPRLTGADAKTD